MTLKTQKFEEKKNLTFFLQKNFWLIFKKKKSAKFFRFWFKKIIKKKKKTPADFKDFWKIKQQIWVSLFFSVTCVPQRKHLFSQCCIFLVKLQN